MKISSLLENITPSSSTANTTSSAPKFGRDEDTLEETTSGCIATVDQPVGKMQRRGKGSIFSGIKTSSKFPNSKTVKEGAYEDGVSDGMRGQVNRRASSIYGPSAGEYDKGYAVGVQKGKEQQQARVSQAQQDSQPYEQMSDEELIQLRKDIQQRTQERQKIYSKLRGSDYSFDPKRHTPPNDSELKAQGAADNKAWHIINQVLWQRGVNIDKLNEQGVAEAQPETHQGSRLDDLNRSTMARYGQELNDLISKIEFHKQGQAASQYKGSMNKMHSEKIRELLAQIEQLKRQYGLNEVSDKTLTSYLTKVDADSQKHEKDPTKRSAEKRNKSVQGFSRAFNKLDARKGKEELD